MVTYLARCFPLVLLVLAGCASTRPASVSSGAEDVVADVEDVEHRLRAATARWHGTPYRLGGTGRSGVDCSGFALAVYNDLFDLALPRTTTDQVRTGHHVRRRDLQAGDLVFFLPETKTRHVGIYLSDGEFAHASTSEGVTISRLDDAYWQEAYWTSRRVLSSVPHRSASPGVTPASPEPPVVQAAPDPPAGSPTGRRVGW